jgi:hypothetical protein
MLEPDLIHYLVNNLTGVTGGVHLGNVPQNAAAPALCVIRLSGTTPRTLGNVALFSRADVQIAVVGDDNYAPVLNVANQVRALLDGFKGEMRLTRIESCRCASEPQDASVIDANKVIRQLVQDFKFVYRDL